MGEILNDYDAIRGLLGVDGQVLPDSVIDGVAYLPLAEAEIKAAVSDWATLAGADRVRLEAGVAALTAARLVPAIAVLDPGMVRVQDYQYETGWGTAAAIRQRQEALELQARRALGGISTRAAARAGTLPAPFKLASPSRARYEAGEEEMPAV